MEPIHDEGLRIHRVKSFDSPAVKPAPKCISLPMNNYSKGWATQKNRKTFNFRAKRSYDGETATTDPRDDLPVPQGSTRATKTKNDPPKKKKRATRLVDLSSLPSYQHFDPATGEWKHA